jgi:N-acetylglutamate synthase-like GNAT family acetyltransferase
MIEDKNMKIRLLQKKDIDQAAAIVGKNYSKKYGKSAMQEIAEMFSKAPIRPVYWVAEEKDKILGFAGYMQSWMDYNIYQIFWVNVLPDMQKQGIGKKLVSKTISEIRKKKNANLILLTANSPIYYKKHFGFKSVQKFSKGSYDLMLLNIEKK